MILKSVKQISTLFASSIKQIASQQITLWARPKQWKKTLPTQLSPAVAPDAVASTATHAICAGGNSGNYVGVNYVYSFNQNLTRQTLTPLPTTAAQLGGTSIGQYAIFGGGYTGSGYATKRKDVVAYNDSLVQTVATSLSSARAPMNAGSNANYALFAGGAFTITTVEAYNSSLTKSTTPSMTKGRYFCRNCTVNNYVLFGGGTQTGKTTTLDSVEVYSSSLVHSVLSMSSKRYEQAACSVARYGIFAGGRTSESDSTGSSSVDCFDENLTRSLLSQLPKGTVAANGASLQNHALVVSTSYPLCCYDTNLTMKTNILTLTSPYIWSQSASNVGKYALVSGNSGRMNAISYE